jgi:eukaryotic-like serine/threonine-protein kinase
VDLHEGLEINERVRLVRPLAQGGMADLWVADHRTLGVEVVVKILAPETAKEATAKRRLIREARVTAKVRCPHVVRVFDHGLVSADDDPFLVLELLRGEDLSARIERMGRLSVNETRTIVEHVSLALEEAHGVGIIHRDVKPANVFLAQAPEGMVAKLVDFGIAKDASEPMVDLTRSDAVMGTPPFMSPEQVVNARDVDSRCDLWSLAAVAYSCLTGKLPFEGDSFSAICIAIHLGHFAPPSTRRPELAASVDAFFAKALCPSIEHRYQSARTFSDAFREATWSDESPDANDAPESTSLSEESMYTATTLLVLDDLGDVLEVGEAVETGDQVPFELARPTSDARLSARGGVVRVRVGRGRT